MKRANANILHVSYVNCKSRQHKHYYTLLNCTMSQTKSFVSMWTDWIAFTVYHKSIIYAYRASKYLSLCSRTLVENKWCFYQRQQMFKLRFWKMGFTFLGGVGRPVTDYCMNHQTQTVTHWCLTDTAERKTKFAQTTFEQGQLREIFIYRLE